MSASVQTTRDAAANPLDIMEQIVTANDWAFDRRGEAEMVAEAPGRWCDYSLYFAWREDIGALHFSCAMDMKVQPAKKQPLYELLASVNERLWLGHFGLWAEEGVPMFRHAVLLRGLGSASNSYRQARCFSGTFRSKAQVKCMVLISCDQLK